jgi:hypothetical protein
VVHGTTGWAGSADAALSSVPAAGWDAATVYVVLVLPEDRTARRRLDTVRSTIDTTLPAGKVAVRR